jgi:hypothetical protein
MAAPKKGHRPPFGLNDVLVQPHYDPIIRVFSALTRVAQDQQIIVFSCR